MSKYIHDNHAHQSYDGELFIRAFINDDTDALVSKLMNLPRPQLNDHARARILARVRQSIPATVARSAPIIHFPSQSVLQLAASVAVFVMILYQFGLPVMTDNESIEKIYPVQRIEELQEADLVSVIFS